MVNKKKCFLCNEELEPGEPFQEIIKRVYNIEGPTVRYYRHLECEPFDLTQLQILIEN